MFVVLAGCGSDPKLEAEVEDLEQRLTELQGKATDLDGRIGALDAREVSADKDLQARLADLGGRLGSLDRAKARGATPGTLVGRWQVHTEPLANHGCSSTAPPSSDYTWDIRTNGSDGALSIAVSGATSFPQIDARWSGGVLSGASVRPDGSVATVVAERVDDELVGYRIFDPRGSDDRCSMTWKLTATRAP